MIITVFGATGQVGKRIVNQALGRGHTVKAFGRNVTQLIDEDQQNNNLQAIHGYVFDEHDVFNAVQHADAVLSALGGAFDGTDKTRSLGIKNIIQQMQNAGVKRIMALGGAGVLSAPNGDYIINQPDYPPEYLPVGREHLQAYLYLKESGLDWTFICSPDIHNADATYNYITSVNYPPQPNHNRINAGDLADCMLQEAENPQHLHQRVGISAK